MLKTPREAYEYAYTNNTLKFPSNWHISANFTWNEVFKNEDASYGLPPLEIYENALRFSNYIQHIRTKFGKPINVHCWYRSIKHNKNAGSKAKYSAHLNALAIDFDVTGVTPAQARSYILALKLPIRIEANTSTWVHIDINTYINPFESGLFYV